MAELIDSEDIYGKKYAGSKMWICRPCRAWVGCHKGTIKPLGRLADAELRGWKVRAHKAFDPRWTGKEKKHAARKQAYAWLAGALGIKYADCHIGAFDVDQCRRVVEICQKGAPDEMV